MKIRNIIATSALILSTSIFSSHAFSAVDQDASIVKLRTHCQENGNTINNCFTDLNTLNLWIWNTRNPSPSPTSPLAVEIGPGTFTGQFTCTGSGFITLTGSGIQNTVIENGSLPIDTSQCFNLVFSNMTIRNTENLLGIRNVGGSTVWSNVEIDGLGYAWFDQGGGSCGAQGKHYWFNSKIIASATSSGSTTAYFNACDESWFFGSEIKSIGSSGNTNTIVAVGGEVHVYGSVIRTIPEAGAIMNSVVAITSTNNAEIHIHGTGIDVISPEANDIIALKASNGGSIHASASSFVLKTGNGGTATRASNDGGNIAAPYQWQTGANPPAIQSLTGADTVVFTNTNDGHPHLAIYDSTCASNWFDTSTNSCQ